MSRKQAYKVGAVLVVLGIVGFAGGRPSGDPHPSLPPSDLSDIWQWDLTRMPPPASPVVRLVLRTRHYEHTDPVPSHPTSPLRAGEGQDRTLVNDTLFDGMPDDCRLTLQQLDLRQLGLSIAESDHPLRFQGVLTMYGSRTRVVVRVAGHSFRGHPVLHPAVWENGERALLTVSTAGTAGHDEYTFLLSTNPE